MRYGLCCDPGLARVAADAGYDFFEFSVRSFLMPREDDAAFQAMLEQIRAVPMPCEATNCFLPGDLKITGPDVDAQAVEQYVATACRRAEEAGVEVIVFGSGAARNAPEGFPRDEASAQLVAFCRMLGPIAAAHGRTIAIEPLCDSNMLTTVAETAALVKEVDHPAIRLLVDSFHWGRKNEPTEDIVANGSLLAHVHLGTVENRLVPGAEEYDFGPFFDALRRGGYDGRVSVEAGAPDPPNDLPRALALLKSLGD